MIRALLAFPINCIRLRSVRRALWLLDYERWLAVYQKAQHRDA